MSQSTSTPRRVGVVMGGPSSEREISLRTGKGVLDALVARGHDAVGVDWKPGGSLPRLLEEARVTVVWNALHGTWGEDGCVQGLLECLGIPYTGSGVLGSANAMDKVMSKRLFGALDVPVARWAIVPPGRADDERALAEIVAPLGLPVVIKPSREGSSVGVTIAKTAAEIAPAVREAARHHGVVLAEEYVKGREINVAVLEDERGVPRALGEVEVRPAVEFYSYEAKYGRTDTQYLCPAPVTDAERARLHAMAERAHAALGCSGYSRVDLIAAGDRVICLEVNTLPGMTGTSLLPKIGAHAGVDYATLCERILGGASLKA